MKKSLSYQARHALLQQAVPQYREASPSQKRMLLDAFVAATGYHRTYARWLLNHAEEVQQIRQRPRPRQYGPDVHHALFLAWHAANRICAKRLIPFLPTLVEALERHEHLHLTGERRSQLLSIRAATADRLLRSHRKRGQRGLSTTRAGTLLKQQIPDPYIRRVGGDPTRLSGIGLGGLLWRIASSHFCLCNQCKHSLLQNVVATSRTSRTTFSLPFERGESSAC